MGVGHRLLLLVSEVAISLPPVDGYVSDVFGTRFGLGAVEVDGYYGL